MVTSFCLRQSILVHANRYSWLSTVASKIVYENPRIIVEASKRNLPQSAWKLNFLVKLIRGAWLPDALAQLKFSPKHRAVDVAKIVQIYHNAIPEELIVREVSVTKGMSYKRPRIMGRGRTGMGYNRWAHVKLKVEKVDFDREILDSKNLIIRKKWIKLKKVVDAIKNQNGPRSSVPPPPPPVK